MPGILANLQWLNTCRGVNIHLLGGDEYVMRCCTVSLNRNELSIGQRLEARGKLAELIKKLPRDMPIALNITGKGVLTRSAAKLEVLGPDNFNQVFPHTEPKDFYCQHLVSGDLSWISIIRKELADSILTHFRSEDIPVLLFSTGPFVVILINNQFGACSAELAFDGHHLGFAENGSVSSYRYEEGSGAEPPLKIGNESIARQDILAYAAAFQLAMSRQLDVIETPVKQVQDAYQEYSEGKKFRLRSGGVLLGFFILLLLNFIVFSIYRDRNATLRYDVSRNTASFENVQALGQEVKNKEQLLKNLGWNKGLSYAWICDQLGKTVPGQVNLQKLEINPLDNAKTGSLRKAVYTPGAVQLSGSTRDTRSLNEWIYQLKESKWIKAVAIKSYKPSTEDDTQQFVLLINY